MHLISAIATPMYILGTYCILFKTPEAMRSVKWYLFTLHIWVVVLDYTISVLFTPYIILEANAFAHFGVLDYLGVSPLVQLLLLMIVFSYMTISIISIFENRFYILCVSGQSYWAIGRRIWLILHHVYFILILIPVIYLVPDQTKAHQLIKIDACILSFVDKGRIFIIAIDVTYHILLAIFSVLFLTAELFIFAFFLYLSVSDKQIISRISATTLQLRKQFLLALFIQTSIVEITLTTPFVVVGWLFSMGKLTQGIMNCCIVLAMTHGFVSTSVMIVVHKPYRLTVIGMFRKPLLERSSLVFPTHISRSL